MSPPPVASIGSPAPPASCTIAGVPQAKASTMLKAKVSGANEGKISAVASWYIGTSSACGFGPRKRIFGQPANRCSSLPRNSPSPINVQVIGRQTGELFQQLHDAFRRGQPTDKQEAGPIVSRLMIGLLLYCRERRQDMDRRLESRYRDAALRYIRSEPTWHRRCAIERSTKRV